jgi:hypothetical protein
MNPHQLHRHLCTFIISEQLSPSTKRLWFRMQAIHDIPLVDNRGGLFHGVSKHWDRSVLSLSSVLAAWLNHHGAELRIFLGEIDFETERFLSRLQQRMQPGANVNIRTKSDDGHNGILGSNSGFIGIDRLGTPLEPSGCRLLFQEGMQGLRTVYADRWANAEPHPIESELR